MKSRSPVRPPKELVDLYVGHTKGGRVSDLTRGALQLAQDLRGQGATLGIHLVRPKDLDDKRVVDAFRRHGVDKLPALLVAEETHVGLDAIRQYCHQESPKAAGTAGTAGPAAASRLADGPVDLASRLVEDESASALEAFYEQEMKAGRREDEIDTWGAESDT
jgi:hypothetical protein